MASKFYVIPVAAGGFLPEEPQICDSKSEALEAAIRIAGRHAGLVIAEEPGPYQELELVRVVGHVDAEVLDRLVS